MKVPIILPRAAYLSGMKYGLLSLFLAMSGVAIGQSYFQQTVNTRIEVRLDDEHHLLHGFEAFTYTNNSPDTLRHIYLHLWPNAYKNDRTMFSEQQITNRSSTFYYSKKSDRGYIDSLDMHVDGQRVSFFSAANTPDIARLDLPQPLAPGKSFRFSTPFRVKVPLVFSRLGHKGTAYYISQWFIKPAVYDRKGWHPLHYSDQGEFFSEIGSYDVQITLPENYIVMATGNCLDESENQWLDSLSKLPLPHFNIPGLITKRFRDSVNRFPKSAAAFKTLHFHEDKIHDFAFFADKRFIVRKDTFSIKGQPGIITAYAAFLPSSKKTWLKAIDYEKETIQQLSEEVGPYPYKTVKAVEGDLRAGGGMEYPTVTVIDRSLNAANLMDVVVHEVGHNWFYGILATNERDHAWMDEGINTFYEHKITARLKADSTFDKRRRLGTELDHLTYYQAAASGTDQAISNTSANFTKANYGSDVYDKAALLLGWLEGYMGTEPFRDGMQEYFNTWQHHHPYPEDLEACLQKHTDKPLDWFFKDALQDDHRIDFSLKKVRTANGVSMITVKNRSQFAAPVRINAFKKGKLTDSLWSPVFSGTTTLSMPAGSNMWRIDNSIADAKTTNNFYKARHLFHGKGIKPGVGFGWNRAEKEKFYLLPALGYNVYDGFTAGMLLHNLSVPENNFRFVAAPMYGFQSKTLVGAGSVGYALHPKTLFQEVMLQSDVKTFDYNKTDHNTDNTLYARYLKVAPSVLFTFKNKSAVSPVNRTLLLKGYYIRENYFSFSVTRPDSIYRPTVVSDENRYGLLRYTYQNNQLLNPYSYSAEAQLGKEYAKITVEGNARIDYNAKNKSLYVRGFIGKFYARVNETFGGYRYWLNTTYSGANDYLYDDNYFGRNEREGAAYHQYSVREGGFDIPTSFYNLPLGRSDNWLAAINVKTDLPFGKLPLRLYFNAATFANAKQINPSGKGLLFEGGAEVHLLYDLILVHLPFVFSKDYNDYLTSIYPKDKLANRISFSIQFQNINWLRTAQGGLKFF